MSVQETGTEAPLGSGEHVPAPPPVTRSNLDTALLWVAFIVFGTVSWVPATAFFTQLPVFILTLPEKYKLYADLDAAMELGNIVPALLFLFGSSFQIFRKYNATIIRWICAAALLTTTMFAIGWHVTISNSTSIVVIVGAWVAGVVGSTSMLVLFNFASKFGTKAMTAMSMGIGLCSAVTNIIGVTQGIPALKEKSSHPISENPLEELNFSPSVYFIIITCWLLAAVVFFFLLDIGPLARLRILPRKADYGAGDEAVGSPLLGADEEVGHDIQQSDGGYGGRTSRCDVVLANVSASVHEFVAVVRLHPGPMAAIFFSCVTEFGLTGLLPYMVPCGVDHASQTFWLGVFYFTGSPAGRILTLLGHFRRFTLLNILQIGIFVYGVIVCHMAAPPPVVISMVLVFLFSLLHGYLVTEVFLIVGSEPSHSAVAGLTNQGGALTGSLISFILVQLHVIVRRTC